MGMSFTKEQQQVIDARNRNLLVSAAAGSGKTAVLVERIIRMILDEEHPTDIDRLLVVTFTNAAAAEMRERIRLAIDDRLAKEPSNEHLQRQAALLHKAQITTIDSFCLFVIRNHFNEIGLDPGFRVADEGELKLLQQDTLNELLEDCYEEGAPEFLSCVEYFTGGSNDRLLAEYIENLYQFSESYPWPEEWLWSCVKDYEITDVMEMEQTTWCSYLTVHIRFMLEELAKKLEKALQLTLSPAGPYMYGELLEQEVEMLIRAAGFTTLREQYEGMEAIRFGRLPSKKDDSVDPELRTMAQHLRNEVKKQIEKLRKDYLLRSPEQTLARMQQAAPMIRELVLLVLRYREQLAGKKRDGNIIDFGDMEHLALQILLKREGETVTPTQAAAEYRACFDEILIDEYQDSNLVQEYLLTAVSGEQDGRYNRFMVGDVKQSIYKFRLARPELFMEKYHTYTKEESNFQRIDLHKNFRSRGEVLSGVNRLFEKIMGKELGGIVYDEDAALFEGAVYPEHEGNETEYLIFTKEEDSGESIRAFEARAIAGQIHRLYRSFQVTDKETGRLRPLQYRDIVILLRTNAGWAEEFKEVLQKEGIPAYVSLRTGYFEAVEIRELLQFLHVIDNPLQDIPLYGTMKSFFGGFSEEEIARIRSGRPCGAKAGAAGGKDTEKQETEKKDSTCYLMKQLEDYRGELQEKVEAFLGMLSHYRRLAVYTPIHKLLQTLIYDTGYLEYVTAKPGGEQRKANVEMLMTKACAFEQTSFFGVFHFLRYIGQLSKYEVDYGEADILDENADVVRIMSIHKSKGLEFPVCIVAGMAKRFNMQDASGRLVADMDLGIGVDDIDSSARIQSSMMKKKAVALKMRLDTLAEEMRVLYVAMTRAKEKLILTAAVKDADKLKEKLALYEHTKSQDGHLMFTELHSAGSYLDFLLPVLGEARLVPASELEGEALKEESRHFLQRDRFLASLNGMEPETETEAKSREALKERMDRSYEFENLQGLVMKTSVSELKKAQMDLEFTKELFPQQEIVPYIPSFMQREQELGGTDRGSAYHRVMELLDFVKVLDGGNALNAEVMTGARDVPEGANGDVTQQEGTACTGRQHELEAQMQEMVRRELLSDVWQDAVSVKKLLQFFESGLAGRMAQAQQKGKLKKEQPFVLGIPAKRLNESFPEEETVLIQGIIDAFFEEEDGLVLMDYKTDVVKTGDELIRRYHTQMEYYTEALERIVGKKVKQRIIYSFALGEEIVM